MQQQIDHLNTNINETITNEKVIKSFVREEFQIRKFEEVNDNLVLKSTSALNFLANIILVGTRASASNKRIIEVLDAKIDLNDDHAKCKDKVIKKGSIRFEHVSFRYYKKNKEKVLNNINLNIESGELVGIIGSSGCGKTTLVSMIPRLYDPDEGAVYVDGVNVKDLSLFHLRESVAMVLQKNTLFSGTIAENLRWGNEDATQEELTDACKIAQADSFVTSF